MRAFKLYAGKDNASHVLEGTLTLDRCTDVMAVHFEESPPLFHIRTGTTHPQRNTSSRLPVRSNSRPATVETFILHPGDVLGGDRQYRKRPQVAPDRRCAMAALPHRAQAGRADLFCGEEVAHLCRRRLQRTRLETVIHRVKTADIKCALISASGASLPAD
jgi:hypothetical protein